MFTTNSTLTKSSYSRLTWRIQQYHPTDDIAQIILLHDFIEVVTLKAAYRYLAWTDVVSQLFYFIGLFERTFCGRWHIENGESSKFQPLRVSAASWYR